MIVDSISCLISLFQQKIINMVEKYSLIFRLLLCLGVLVRVGNGTQQPFPSCNQPLEKTVRRNRGNNVDVGVTFFESSPCRNYWYAAFIWVSSGGNEICRSPERYQAEFSTSNGRYDMIVRRQYTDGKPFGCLYHFEIKIAWSVHDDHGVYLLNSSYGGESCTFLRLNVIVREPIPQCTTLLVEESATLKLTCEWIPRDPRDKMEFSSGHPALKIPEHQIWTRGIETVISITVAIKDVFDIHRTPDSCTISNSRLGFENRCKFAILMPPNVHEFKGNGSQASFTCCTGERNTPSLWFFSGYAQHVYRAGQSLTLDMDNYYRQGPSAGTNSSLVAICGKENQNPIMSFRIGKLVFRPQFGTSISLRAVINRIEGFTGVSNTESQSCEYVYNISIIATLLENEQSTKEGTSSPATYPYSSESEASTMSEFQNTANTEPLTDLSTNFTPVLLTGTDENEMITQLETPFSSGHFMIGISLAVALLLLVAAGLTVCLLVREQCVKPRRYHTSLVKRTKSSNTVSADEAIDFTNDQSGETVTRPGPTSSGKRVTEGYVMTDPQNGHSFPEPPDQILRSIYQNSLQHDGTMVTPEGCYSTVDDDSSVGPAGQITASQESVYSTIDAKSSSVVAEGAVVSPESFHSFNDDGTSCSPLYQNSLPVKGRKDAFSSRSVAPSSNLTNLTKFVSTKYVSSANSDLIYINATFLDDNGAE